MNRNQLQIMNTIPQKKFQKLLDSKMKMFKTLILTTDPQMHLRT